MNEKYSSNKWWNDKYKFLKLCPYEIMTVWKLRYMMKYGILNEIQREHVAQSDMIKMSKIC